jgi:hypothetical protein
MRQIPCREQLEADLVFIEVMLQWPEGTPIIGPLGARTELMLSSWLAATRVL